MLTALHVSLIVLTGSHFIHASVPKATPANNEIDNPFLNSHYAKVVDFKEVMEKRLFCMQSSGYIPKFDNSIKIYCPIHTVETQSVLSSFSNAKMPDLAPHKNLSDMMTFLEYWKAAQKLHSYLHDSSPNDVATDIFDKALGSMNAHSNTKMMSKGNDIVKELTDHVTAIRQQFTNVRCFLKPNIFDYEEDGEMVYPIEKVQLLALSIKYPETYKQMHDQFVNRKDCNKETLNIDFSDNRLEQLFAGFKCDTFEALKASNDALNQYCNDYVKAAEECLNSKAEPEPSGQPKPGSPAGTESSSTVKTMSGSKLSSSRMKTIFGGLLVAVGVLIVILAFVYYFQFDRNDDSLI